MNFLSLLAHFKGIWEEDGRLKNMKVLQFHKYKQLKEVISVTAT